MGGGEGQPRQRLQGWVHDGAGRPGGAQFRPVSAPVSRSGAPSNTRPYAATSNTNAAYPQHSQRLDQRQHRRPTMDIDEDEEPWLGGNENGVFDYFAEEEESVGTLATSMHPPGSALNDHQVTKAGCVYYFNAPHRESDPTLAALKAGSGGCRGKYRVGVGHGWASRFFFVF